MGGLVNRERALLRFGGIAAGSGRNQMLRGCYSTLYVDVVSVR